jgi:hypothetical protein
MEIELKITLDSLDFLTWRDWEAIESGEISYKEARRIVAMFMVDQEGKPIEHTQAMDTLGDLSFREMKLVLTNFSQAIRKKTSELVPNGSGGD